MKSSGVKPFGDTIGDVELAEKLFGDAEEITWLKDCDWEYTRMTLTRDGKMDWKDEDTWDHDTICFSGTYTLAGTEAEFTVTGSGDSRAYFDAYKDTQSSHHHKAVTERFESSRFTGEGFTVTRK